MSPSSTTFTVNQNLFYQRSPPLRVEVFQASELNKDIFERLNQHALATGQRHVGLAAAYYGDNKCILSSLALAASTEVVVINLPRSVTKARKRLIGDFLSSAAFTKAAFHLDTLVAALHYDFRIPLAKGLDLLSVAPLAARESLDAMIKTMGGESEVNKRQVDALFVHRQPEAPLLGKDLALQAWAAWNTAVSSIMASKFYEIPVIDTPSLRPEHLDALSKLVRDAQRLDALKPTAVQNEIADNHTYEGGKFQVTCTRFKNRIRSDAQARTVSLTPAIQTTYNKQRIEVRGHDDSLVASGRVDHVDGRQAKLNIRLPLATGGLKVVTVGKEAPTSAERRRATIVLHALQGTSSILSKPFFKALWLPTATDKPQEPGICIPIASTYPRPLNPSQRSAVAGILSSAPVTVIQGPPGTGKTTVIAAAVWCIDACAAAHQRAVYCIAQSNVAVKNMAEKLASVGFYDFKLVVSKGATILSAPSWFSLVDRHLHADFHYDWHEHLYYKIDDNVLRADQLSQDILDASLQLAGSRFILCTLSMLANPHFGIVTRILPPHTIVVDEASQIEIGDFLPMIELYSTTLRKMVFVGDDKQLAPYGQGQIDSLRSVFEMKHLRQDAIFLDTQSVCFHPSRAKFDIQCKPSMPTQLGGFISQNVYEGKLRSVHKMRDRCWWFVDVPQGEESMKGSSWINMGEVKAVVDVARKLKDRGKSFRVITPYDAQRGMLERNEDDFIVLSLVRTRGVGFMNETRRVNVMLTRCKKGLIVCTNRGFVQGQARNTLIGLLADRADSWAPLKLS
ncbi:hypothetical protein HMN09_00404200 [Mycena chlorophos]|uniref:DNA2/NAM7 helicase-like C-terminal domain-containing protein n=1 Tax=Mycena chlorophos TaxID=658473 RepID=A0A8H6WH80_MYCCL|nr:hypothetical protein HMN09_00404200 [Mycena chlorophos]